MRKKLGEKFGVVFSFSVVVTGTELIPSSSIDSPKCTYGHWRQTAEHLLLSCRYHLSQRKELRKHIKPLPLTWQTAMHTGKGLKGTIGFLTETGVGTRTWVLGPKMADVGSFGYINSETTEGGG